MSSITKRAVKTMRRHGWRKVAGTFSGALALLLMMSVAGLGGQTPVQLKLWHNQNQPDAQASFQALIDAFQKANPDVKVTQQIFNWVDVKPKVMAAISAGTAPEMMQVLPDQLIALMETGKIMPVDDIVQPIDEKFRFIKTQLTPFQGGGKSYAIPAFAI